LINRIIENLKSSVRKIDTISRMGGDEFLIIFPGCFEAEAEKVIQRINCKLENYDKKNKKPYQHAFSYGILELSVDNKLSINAVINAADKKCVKIRY